MTKKKTTSTDRLRNWTEYNTALVQRGRLTVWVSEDVIESWYNQERTEKRGKPATYADAAIECMAMLKENYHLPLRATQGLLESIFRLMGMDLSVPDDTTLCRRPKRLAVSLPRRTLNEPLHLVIDSTGVKNYGEGEWKVRQHGYSKRRTWRKLHLGVDEASQEIVAALVTTHDVADGDGLSELLHQVEDPIEQVSGEGAYDKRKWYQTIKKRKAQVAIPPRRNARIWQHGTCRADPHPRDENLRKIRHRGRHRWKQDSGYHRPSLAETQMFRLKTIFGDRVRARDFNAQATQILLRCAALNRMTHLGMPDSVAA